MEIVKIARQARMQRLLLATAVSLILVGVLTLSMREDLSYLLFGSFGNRQSIVILGLATLAYGIAILMLQYLRGTITFSFLDKLIKVSPGEISYEQNSVSSSPLSDSISNIKKEVEKLKSTQVGVLGGNREDLVRSVKETLTSDITDELEKRFSSSAIDLEKLMIIRRSFESTNGRIQAELSALARRGNLNLVIGSVTTALAVGLLVYMVLGTKADLTTLTSLLAYYIPRVSVVIFIEVFAFFFLRLYKATLQEIRMYQIDMTRLSVTVAAIESAWASSEVSAKALLSK